MPTLSQKNCTNLPRKKKVLGEKTSIAFDDALRKLVKIRGIKENLNFGESVEAACIAWVRTDPLVGKDQSAIERGQFASYSQDEIQKLSSRILALSNEERRAFVRVILDSLTEVSRGDNPETAPLTDEQIETQRQELEARLGHGEEHAGLPGAGDQGDEEFGGSDRKKKTLRKRA